MRMRAPARSLAIAGAIAISAATLTATPAQAAPVFTTATLQSEYFGHADGSCSTDSETGSPELNLPVTENGPAVSGTQSADATVSDGGGDSQTGSVTTTGSGAVSSTGTNLKEISLTTTGQWAVTQTQPVSICQIHLGATIDLDFEFVVTQPGFLDIDIKSRGRNFTEFYVEMVSPVSSPYFQQYGEGLEFDSSSRVYLPAGTYSGYAYSQTTPDDITVASAGVSSGSVKATFSPIGSQTEAAAGKGKRYVTLPAAARDCTTDTVTASITDSKKRVKLIKQVKLFVNGKLKKKVKNPRRGDVVALTGIADGVAADVRALVKLEKKANGKKRNPVEVTASYEACAPSA